MTKLAADDACLEIQDWLRRELRRAVAETKETRDG
jgi:hypothetical protein